MLPFCLAASIDALPPATIPKILVAHDSPVLDACSLSEAFTGPATEVNKNPLPTGLTAAAQPPRVVIIVPIASSLIIFISTTLFGFMEVLPFEKRTKCKTIVTKLAARVPRWPSCRGGLIIAPQ